MPLALLFAFVGMSLSALVAPPVITQTIDTRQEVQRAHAVHAALAGIDAAVAGIRNATDGDGNGVLAGLPACNGSISGDVGGAGYSVATYYLSVDPVGQSTDWAVQNAICTSGTPPTSPRYALLVATGADRTAAGSAVHRTVRATYVFRTTDARPPGGRIWVYQTAPVASDYNPVPYSWGYYSYAKPAPSVWDLCLDAGSSAAAGTPITMQSCRQNSPGQLFAYGHDLALMLVGSQTAGRPEGLCLDAGSTHARHNLLKAQNCGSGQSKPYQRWAFNSNANFEGTTSGAAPDGFCFNVKNANTPGSPVWLGTVSDNTCGQNYDDVQTFIPGATVGAGLANPPNNTGQFVNFGQFGRCLDIPGGETSRKYLIGWPCKQAFDGTVAWNQKWAPPGAATTCPAAPCRRGIVTVTAPAGEPSPAGTYCLETAPTIGGFVSSSKSCSAATAPASMTWTIYGDTGDPLTRYHIVDHRGYCVAPSDTELFQDTPPVSKIVLATCRDDPAQMWNAPADILDPSPLRDITEQ